MRPPAPRGLPSMPKADDEDWYDEDESFDDDPAAICPECSGTVYSFSEKCPHCGYWLSDADRRKLYPGESKPFWQRTTAVIMILVFLICLLVFGAAIF
jgi:predicted amidophosphoribosyltransferase